MCCNILLYEKLKETLTFSSFLEQKSFCGLKCPPVLQTLEFCNQATIEDCRFTIGWNMIARPRESESIWNIVKCGIKVERRWRTEKICSIEAAPLCAGLVDPSIHLIWMSPIIQRNRHFLQFSCLWWIWMFWLQSPSHSASLPIYKSPGLSADIGKSGNPQNTS